MIGDLINKFDNLRDSSVSAFNATFPQSKIPKEIEFENNVIRVLESWEVEIGELHGGTTRQIFIIPPGQPAIYTFIEMKNDETYQAVLIAKKKKPKHQLKKTYLPMIRAIISSTNPRSERYGQGSSGVELFATSEVGEDDSEGFSDVHEEQDD